ncbi:MAG: DUF4136 domain-containing protein [Chloracidobacterium sp.]|nr:DUF4136 domain-containing protein [Chloracidobacterium sp.]
MRLIINRVFCVLSLVVSFGSVALGQTVTSTYDEDANLSRLRTFVFKEQKRERLDRLATDTLTEKKIKEALSDELEAGGYRPAAEGISPDFLISFLVGTRDKNDERGRDKSYVQGSLIVDFFDAETDGLVWRGIASGIVGQDAVDLKLTEEKVKRAAKLLMELFAKNRAGI